MCETKTIGVSKVAYETARVISEASENIAMSSKDGIESIAPVIETILAKRKQAIEEYYQKNSEIATCGRCGINYVPKKLYSVETKYPDGMSVIHSTYNYTCPNCGANDLEKVIVSYPGNPELNQVLVSN